MVLPPKIAPKDKPTLAKMLSANSPRRLLSNRLFVSRANDDIVVNDPQKPTATRRVYFESRLNAGDITEKNPKIKLPKIFTIKTLSGKPYIAIGDSTSRYLKYAPATAPTASRANSINFIPADLTCLIAIKLNPIYYIFPYFLRC